MLTQEQIEQNKNEFLQLLAQVQIVGCDTEGLVEFLEKYDFFHAPASTIYHCNYEGGLCQHSLNVYHNLVNLHTLYADKLPAYDKSTFIVLGLLHDISKANYYEKTIINKKKYSEKGLKHDNMGKFDWFAEDAFKVKDATDRFLLGSHEIASSLIVGRYIPLTLEETLAIMYHQAIPSEGQPIRDMSAMLDKYPLITLIQLADYASTFIFERMNKAENNE